MKTNNEKIQGTLLPVAALRRCADLPKGRQSAAALVSYLAAFPSASLEEISDILDTKPARIKKRLRSMARAGVLSVEWEGKEPVEITLARTEPKRKARPRAAMVPEVEHWVPVVDAFHKKQTETFPKLRPLTTATRRAACECLARVVRLDGYTSDQVREALVWALQDEFWAQQVRSLSAIRKTGRNGSTKFANICAAMPGHKVVSDTKGKTCALASMVASTITDIGGRTVHPTECAEVVAYLKENAQGPARGQVLDFCSFVRKQYGTLSGISPAMLKPTGKIVAAFESRRHK